jgi:hypothetical protein
MLLLLCLLIQELCSLYNPQLPWYRSQSNPTQPLPQTKNNNQRFTTKLLPSLSGNLGVIKLNHPKALNALAMDMIDCFEDTLDNWYSSKNGQVKAILLKAADNRQPRRKSQHILLCRNLPKTYSRSAPESCTAHPSLGPGSRRATSLVEPVAAVATS